MQQHHYSEGTHILIANHESTYAIKDHLGSIHNNIGINSNFVYTSFFYNPYGRSYRSSQTGTNPDDLRYAGMFYLPEQELYFTRYRAYDASTGRWLSRDPIAEQGGINLYGYVGGNPVNFNDPLGLEPNIPYPNVNTAGEQAIRDINSTSIRQGVEYAGRICGNTDGSCFYTQPNKGGKAWSYGGICPKDTSQKGHYHTHGNYDKRYDNENFSELDKVNIDKTNQIGFLGTPKGRIKTYTPVQDSPLSGNIETIGKGAK